MSLPAASQADLEKRFKSGANWFYWIAALSMLNSVIMLCGSEMRFIVGLGITSLFDAVFHVIAQHNPNIAVLSKGIGFGFSFAIAAVFAAFGIFANKRHAWSFIVGMILYSLDGLLLVLIQDWMSVGFHGFALFGIFTGYQARGSLLELERQPTPVPLTPSAEPPAVPALPEQAPPNPAAGPVQG